jgi:lysophospholipase L1-like esterase
MKKTVKSFSVFLIMCTFIAFNFLSFIPVSGAQVGTSKLASVGVKTSPATYGKIEPFVGVEHSKLAYGEAETFALISKNYDGQVQYRLWLNKKDSNIWMDITGGYSSPVVAKNPYTFKYDKSLEPGEYKVVAWVKAVGSNGIKVNSNGLRYDNYAVANFQCVKSDDKEKVSKTIYTALGDSIAFGLSADPGKGYVPLFHNYLKTTETFSKSEVTNLSMPGDKSSDLLAKLKNDTITRESVKNSNVITISIGGNNLLSPLIETIVSEYKLNPKDLELIKNLALAVSTDTKLQEKMAVLISSEKFTTALTLGITQFMTDSKSIIEETRLLAPKAEIYVMTLYNPFNAKDPFFNVVDPYIQKINAMINNSNGLYKVADVYTLFNKYQGDKPLTNFSLLKGAFDPHPTNEGHNLILQAHIEAK